ncbi:cytochrome P450 [Aspergillus saccharolyticus JOP 1030-1]|uniref:Putative cytochrome P450 alkane hydroxylase n=1 Tax=Aspergillus saccharolyticus JOP 1030-1 TaxID=1450539 RepID=A0A318ZLF1_9EURO|nr:putative cytochrome P450 alkane hydroxylase [Aspergillus saccharolyticus JOP 1030-1]PYH44630.1 putative cytochrome P450 alkane hydroxylase [Aspergillus saccharolyticus JOP 1030-1]
METYKSHPPVAIVAVAALFLWSVITYLNRRWKRYRIARTNQCRPPPALSEWDPFFGLDGIYQRMREAKEHKFLQSSVDRFETYGNTFRARRLATTVFATREPENVKTILSLRFKDYGLGNRIQSFGPLLGHGIFTADGEHWVQSRAMVRPNFVKEQVAHLDSFEELMNDLLALIPADGTTVDLQDLFFGFTIDSATDFLFGHSVHSLKKRRAGLPQSIEAEKDFAEAFNYSQDAIATRARLGKLMYFYRDPKAARCDRICHDLVEQFVEKAVRVRERYSKEDSDSQENHRYLFLDGLARQTGDRTRIRDELLNVLLAGRDTTASLLSNLFFMLAKHPEVWKKLRDEVATLEGRTPTYEQLRNLTYLKYCLNESLRLHPVVPANARFAQTDTILPTGGGPDGKSPILVPKGSVVSYSVFAMHRRKDFFGPDAQEFRPERWADLRPGWEYLPFNGGPRICVGQQYALTEAGYVTTRLAQKFSTLESRDPGPWEESLTLTCCSRNGTKVGLR